MHGYSITRGFDHQDKLGYRARIAYQSDPVNRTLTIFVKKLSSSSSPRAASMFNRGGVSATLTLTRPQLGFDTGTCGASTDNPTCAHWFCR